MPVYSTNEGRGTAGHSQLQSLEREGYIRIVVLVIVSPPVFPARRLSQSGHMIIHSFTHITIPNPMPHASSHPKLKPLTRRKSMVRPGRAERARIDLGPLCRRVHAFKEGGVHASNVALFVEDFELMDDCPFGAVRYGILFV
jgi:hypothetical protein